jgi:signal transduction histidine kinase
VRRPVEPQQARQGTYLLLGLVFGTLWFAVIGGLYVAGLFGQFVALLTVPNVVFAQLLLRPIGRFERFLVISLLGQDVPAPEPVRYARSTRAWWSGTVNAVRRSYAVFQDGHSWRVLVWVLVRSVVGPLGFVVVVLPVLLVFAPLAVVADSVSDAVSIDFAGKQWLLLGPVGLVFLPVLRRVTRAVATLHRRLAVWALGPGRGEIAAAALARAAQAEEQVRIDQELHDSIGHMLSMIVVQAGAGAHVFDNDPDFARCALGTIEQRGRAALAELDRIIANIHGDYAAGTWHGPLPDGQSLPVLIASAREAGMDVVSRIRIGELSPALGRGVYRIVQEGLTNAAKHAAGAAVRVDIAADEGAVAVYIVNDFDGVWPTPARPAGHGLASIRDRAALLGGEATAGATEHGEFAVSAVLPLAELLPGGTTARCSFTRRCTCLGCTIRRSVLE